MRQGSSDANEQTEREDADSTAGFTEEFVMPEQGGGVTQVLSSCWAVQAAGKPQSRDQTELDFAQLEFGNGMRGPAASHGRLEKVPMWSKEKAESWGSSF